MSKPQFNAVIGVTNILKIWVCVFLAAISLILIMYKNDGELIQIIIQGGYIYICCLMHETIHQIIVNVSAVAPLAKITWGEQCADHCWPTLSPANEKPSQRNGLAASIPGWGLRGHSIVFKLGAHLRLPSDDLAKSQQKQQHLSGCCHYRRDEGAKCIWN